MTWRWPNWRLPIAFCNYGLYEKKECGDKEPEHTASTRKFFHTSTLFKRKKNEIIQININSRSIHGVSNLKSEIRNYFAQRFAQEQVSAFDFSLDNHLKITVAQVVFLERIPSIEEVKQALWACGIDKAPGFDGYNFKFIREMWDTIKEEIYGFVLDFFVTNPLMRQLNVT